MANQIDRAQIEAFRDDASEIMNEWEAACLRAGTISRAAFFQALLRCAHNLKGNAGLMGFEHLASSMHRLEDRLIVLEGSKESVTNPSFLGILLEIEKFIRDWVGRMVDNPDFVPDTLSVLAKLEALQTDGKQGQVVESDTSVLRETSSSSGNESVRIASQKLDSLIQLVGELTLAQAIVSRGRTEELLETAPVRDAVALCDKLVRSLRLTVLDMRMLPMLGLYSKLERAGMELSIKLQKPLSLLVEGQEVSVDKAVLNKIFDPLLHLLRNAIDHGIESPDERIKAGKPTMGTIRVTAAIAPSGVEIRIKDDGRGLDLKRIRQKGVERGLVRADEILSDAKISNLIFEPGFSTAETVTDISGRGVGLDVVKKEVMNLGGQVDLKSTFGTGTEFIITLPVNISLIDVLVVHNQGHLYCVPTQDIVEVIDLIDVKPQSSAMYRQMIHFRNRVLPIEPLEYFLNQTAGPVELSTQEGGCILVVNYQDEVIGIQVGAVTHQQQVFVRMLKGYMASLPCLTGSTILSNGEPSLIINVKEMANNYFVDRNRGAVSGEHSI